MKKSLLLATLLGTAMTTSLSAADPAPQTYTTCMACHGPDGKGIAIGAMMMAPSLHGSPVVTAGDGEILASVILNGIEKEDQKFMGMMAPLAATLDAQKLAEVMNYVRTNFDNDASEVTEEQAAAWMEKYKDQPFHKRADLEAAVEAAKAE